MRFQFPAMILLIIGSVAVPSRGDEKDLKIGALEAKVAALEKRVAALEEIVTKTLAPPTASTQIVELKPISPGSSPLVLDDWDFQFQKGDIQNYYAITLKLRNVGTKAIKLIEAAVSFSDLLDHQIYGIRISPDIFIAPGQTHTDTGNYDINMFMNEQLRMKDMKKADIKAQLHVKRVVFADNTILEVKQ